MKDSMRCVESRQLHKEGYLQQSRVEPKEGAGVRSISTASEKGRNDGSGYAEDLLEKILNRDNMNRAYKKVKANKGSQGANSYAEFVRD